MRRVKIACIAALLAVSFLFSTTAFAAIPPDYQQFVSTIPDVTEEMLYPDFWIDKPGQAKKVIMDAEEIADYNTATAEAIGRVVELVDYPDTLTGQELADMITLVSVRTSSMRYDIDGNVPPDDYWPNMTANMNLGGIPEVVPVRFGITVGRTNLRIFPSEAGLYSSKTNHDTDRLQWTAVYAEEPIAVLHTSADGQWYFGHIYTCFAWIPARDVALAPRTELFSYVNREPFLVVTGERVFTQPNPDTPAVSEVQLDMGIRVPLATPEEIGEQVDRQPPGGNVVVMLPIRGNDGNAIWKPALIARLADVNIGYLPYTQENIIRQAFKMQGQRYGWGGQFNARDCSAFLLDVFKSMGVLIPRNSSEQGGLAPGIFYEMTSDMTLEQKLAILDGVDAGAMLWMSGHVMLYIGKSDGAHFMIHDSGYARGVAVTPVSIYDSFRGARFYVLPDDAPGNGNKWGH